MIDVINKANGTRFYPISDDAPSDEEDYGAPAVTPDVVDAAVTEPERQLDRQAADLPTYHPKTMAEAVRIIIGVLDAETKDQIRASVDKGEYGLENHFGLALWVRNAMIHLNKNSLDLYADFEKGCRKDKWDGMAEPDSVSGVIVGLVWEALHKPTK